MYMRSKLIPRLKGHVIKWLDSEYFIVSVRGQTIIGHKDYWEGVDDGYSRRA